VNVSSLTPFDWALDRAARLFDDPRLPARLLLKPSRSWVWSPVIVLASLEHNCSPRRSPWITRWHRPDIAFLLIAIGS